MRLIAAAVIASLTSFAGAQIQGTMEDRAARLQAHREAMAQRTSAAQVRQQRIDEESARLAAMAPDARDSYFRSSIEERLSSITAQDFSRPDHVVSRLLSALRYELDESGARPAVVVTDSAGESIGRFTPGQYIPLRLEDDSVLGVFIVLLDQAEEKLLLGVGDFVYTVSIADSSVTLDTELVLEEYKGIILGFSIEGETLDINTEPTFLQEPARLITKGSGTPVYMAENVDPRVFRFDSANRSLENTLSELCVTYGVRNGRGLIWEKLDDYYLLRPFPLGENILDLVADRIELVSIGADGRSATVMNEGDPELLELEDSIRLMLPVDGYLEVVIERVDSARQEITLRGGGQRAILATVGQELAAKPMALGEVPPNRDQAFRVVSQQAGITIAAASDSDQEMIHTPKEIENLGDLLRYWRRTNGWGMRWVDGGTLVIGPQATLQTK